MISPNTPNPGIGPFFAIGHALLLVIENLKTPVVKPESYLMSPSSFPQYILISVRRNSSPSL